jgi:ubiquinone/menaquinone biosynthesis C-methylase UbiE
MKSELRSSRSEERARKPGGQRVALDALRAWMHEGLRDLGPGRAILALGCDEAFLTPQLLEYASDVTVLDTSGGQIAQLARRFPEITFLPHHPAQPLPFARGAFDAIWCCEYLDRVFDPVAALREMHRVLVPGGRLLATVADHGRVRNVLIALFNWDEHFTATTPRVRYFTKRTLARLTREAGFTAVQLTTSRPARKVAGRFAPPNLLLKARKDAGLELAPAERRDRADGDVAFDEDLAFAGRTRAA